MEYNIYMGSPRHQTAVRKVKKSQSWELMKVPKALEEPLLVEMLWRWIVVGLVLRGLTYLSSYMNIPFAIHQPV